MKYPILFRIAALAAAFVCVSCSGEDERLAPLKKDTESAVGTAIPSYLSLVSMETEIIPSTEGEVRINFKASVKTKEDLFIAERSSGSDRGILLLKRSQSSGAVVNLYGSMKARRIMDKWNISRPNIESGTAQLGSPRGSYDSRAMIEGSEEMKQFMAAQDAERAAEARAQEEERKKSEDARIALLERKKHEEEAKRKLLMAATAVGKRYTGIIVVSPGRSNETRQAVELLFTAQSGALITAELHNPDQTEHKQTFTGELLFAPDEDSTQSDEGHYSIVLSPRNPKTTRVSENERDRLRIYFEDGNIRLNSHDKGLEGIAATIRTGERYTLRLQAAE